jgi:hypothetical protein
LVLGSDPTPADRFDWAVGIEDTFIPQLARTTGRLLDEYALTQHYERWREDLDLAASLGVKSMRYGIPWLMQHHANQQTLRWLHEHAQGFDVMGVNFYPGMSAHRLTSADGAARRAAYQGGGTELERVVRTYAAEYRRPVMITETSTIGSIRRRAAWMDESMATVRRLRGDGVPVVGYTRRPMFSLVTWTWRTGGKDLAAYLGHMGLWDLVDDGRGRLDRRPTVLVDRFRAFVADTLGSVGPLAVESGRAGDPA